MKVQSLTRSFMQFALCCALVLTMAFISGCKGSSGSDGAVGATGPTGTAGAVTNTSESCNVCHTDGRIAAVTTMHTANLGRWNPGLADLVISNVSVSNVGGKARVFFHVDKRAAGATALASYTTLTAAQVGLKIADLIPASTPTTSTGAAAKTFSTDYWELWLSDTATNANMTYTDAANGNYMLLAKTAFGTPTAGYNVNEYSAANVKRIMLTINGDENKDGTYDYHNAVAFQDIAAEPALNSAATVTDGQRQFVTIDACKKCHGPQMDGAAHASSYLDTKGCVLCHSPLYGSSSHYVGFMDDDDAMLTVFIHQIHANKYTNANTMPEANGDYLVGQPITFPQEISNCVVCHTNSNQTLGTGDKIDNWKTNPTRRVCGSCHTTTDFASASTTHAGGQQLDDTACKGCHSATKIFNYHDTNHPETSVLHPNTANVPEYDVTLALTAPANGSYYAAGEAVDITATLNDHGGSAVAGSLYTTASDTKGISGGGLNVASLYVYGPRAKALPLTGTQANKLFTGSTNTFVTTDTTGFKYHLIIPSNATAGTYMVRFRAADYGYVSDTDYKLESVAFQNIQIGTATAEVKVSGDACVNCHGEGTAPFHDARHVVTFDTDQCLGCHDQSGGHADPIANRVHAVHSASNTGDLVVSAGTWTDVTFPQQVANCVSCHASTSTAFKTNLYAVPCYGCHADNTGSKDHMLQNGGQGLPQ